MQEKLEKIFDIIDCLPKNQIQIYKMSIDAFIT